MIAWDEVPAIPAANGVTKRRIDLAGISLVAVTVPAGTEAVRHDISHGQFVQVLSGSGVLTTENGARAFAAGSVFVFPARTWHSVRFEADTVLVQADLAV